MKRLILVPVLFALLSATVRARPGETPEVASARVLLFATSDNDADATLRRNSMDQLQSRLIAGGLTDADITVVHAKASNAVERLRSSLKAVSGSAGVNDSVLIYIAASQSESRSGRLRIGNRDWPLQELVNGLFTSASSRRGLFVDPGTAGTRNVSGLSSTGLVLPSNLWMAVSRSGRRETSESGKQITAFSSAVGNALCGCADAPGAAGGDGILTLLEVTEYLRAYAEAFDFPAPGITGKISGDGAFLRASRNDALRSVSDETRQTIADNTIENAAVLLFHERKPSEALAVLGDAKRIAVRNPDHVVRLLQTAQAATGQAQRTKLAAAIKSGIADQGSIRLQLGRETIQLYSPGKATKKLPAVSGDVLLATAVKDEALRTWIWVEAVYRVRQAPDDTAVETTFKEVPELKKRWALLGDLVAPTASKTAPAQRNSWHDQVGQTTYYAR